MAIMASAQRPGLDRLSCRQLRFGTTLLALFAFIGDALPKYQDNQARGCQFLTVTQRKT